MKHCQNLRLVVARSLLGSALLASSAFALTPSELDSLRAKADHGNAIAQYNLGLAYADRGESIYDPAQAYAWLSLAAENGTNGKALATLTSLLTPEQLAEGKRLLAALTTSPVSTTPAPVVAAEPAPVIAVAAVSEPAPSPVVEPDQHQKKLSAELAAAWRENELLKAGLTAKLADANKRIAIAEAALASKDKEIAALQARPTETPASSPVVSSAPIGMSAELASLRAERDQLQATVTSTATELASLRAGAAKVSADQAALREKLTAAAESVANAKRAQSLAESEAASLKAAADRATAERLAVAAQLESVTAELEKAKAAPTPVVAPAAVAPAPELISETGLKTLTAERDRLAASVMSLEKERDSLAEKLSSAGSSASDKLSSAIKELEKTKLALAAQEKESSTLTAQLAAAKAAVPVASAPEVVVAPIPTVPTPPAAV